MELLFSSLLLDQGLEILRLIGGSAGDTIAYSYLIDTPAWLGFFDATVIAFCFLRLALAATHSDSPFEPSSLSPPFLIAASRPLIFARALWLASRPVADTVSRRHMELFAAIHGVIALVWLTLGIVVLAAAWSGSDEQPAKAAKQKGLGYSALSLLLGALLMALRHWLPSSTLHGTSTILAAWLGLLLGVAGLLFYYVAAKESMPPKLTNRVALRYAALALLFCSLAMAAGYWMPGPSLHETPMALAMGLGLLLGITGLLYFAAKKVRLPLVGPLASWIVLSALLGWDDHHTIRTMTGEPGAAPAPRAFKNWLAERRGTSTGKFPVVIVVSEGGGIRAAIMTTTVLDELRIRVPEWKHHLFAIVGVSGGSVGAAAYAAAIYRNRPPVAAAVIEANPAAGGWQASLYNDMLSPALRSMLSGETLSHLIPRPLIDLSSHDRVRALEYAWEANWKQATNTRIDDLSFSTLGLSATTDQPALVLLTTSTRTGERMAVSHLTFGPDPKVRGGVSILTLADELPCSDLPLATSAFLSARFPLVSPPARLPGEGEARRYVDGGYFENSGVSTVLDMLRLIQNEAAHKADFLVIRIENGDVEEHKSEAQLFPLVEFRQPLNALLLTGNARAERAIAELNETVQASEQCQAADSGCLRIRQAVFRLHPDPGKPKLPLGWFISGPARAEIAHQVAFDNERAFAEVKDVLRPVGK